MEARDFRLDHSRQSLVSTTKPGFGRREHLNSCLPHVSCTHNNEWRWLWTLREEVFDHRRALCEPLVMKNKGKKKGKGERKQTSFGTYWGESKPTGRRKITKAGVPLRWYGEQRARKERGTRKPLGDERESLTIVWGGGINGRGGHLDKRRFRCQKHQLSDLSYTSLSRVTLILPKYSEIRISSSSPSRSHSPPSPPLISRFRLYSPLSITTLSIQAWNVFNTNRLLIPIDHHVRQFNPLSSSSQRTTGYLTVVDQNGDNWSFRFIFGPGSIQHVDFPPRWETQIIF